VKKPQYEVADIFLHYGYDYRKTHSLPINQLRAMRAIEICRTAALGGHLSKCDLCGVEQPVYNSCRNRHCPKCQHTRTEKWIDQRKKEVLPVNYFHIVFTVPDLLNPIIKMNEKALYTIFFKSVSETLLELGKDSKHLGAQIGSICILHTWGPTMTFHPHIHCIVTGGGLCLDEQSWISFKKGFFMPVHVLSNLFRGKFLAYLKQTHLNKSLKFSKEMASLKVSSKFKTYLNPLYKKGWVVYAKPPFNSPDTVIEYLGRYTHKVAISNPRILKLKNDQVSFTYRDYSDGSNKKIMTLEAPEFIRRFLMHILPDRFVKIRYYGLLSHRKKKDNRLKVYGALDIESNSVYLSSNQVETPNLTIACPYCKKGVLIKTNILLPIYNIQLLSRAP